IDPGVIWILLRTRIALEPRPGDRIERETFRAFVPALGARPVERALAFAPVETRDMPRVERHPHHAVAIDVAAANAEAGQRNFVDFRERGVRRVATRGHPQDVNGVSEIRSPD